MFEIFMQAWESLANANPELGQYINAGMKVAKKYYSRMDQTNAYAVALCKFNISLS
jgi:hypothetical protein